MARRMLAILGTASIVAAVWTASIVAAVLGSPGVASAHATLERSEPAANSVVDTSPSRVLLVFTEPIELSLADIKLLGPGGVIVADPELRATADAGVEFDVPSLANGTYTVTIRVVSATDGHPTRENFSFAVGEPLQQAAVAGTEEGSGGPPRVVQAAAKFLSYLSLVAVVAVAFLLARGTRLSCSRLVAIAGLVLSATMAALVIQSWIAAGTLAGVPGELGTVLTETRFGKTWALRVILSACVAVVLLRARPRRRDGMLLGAFALGLALPASLNSHVAGHGSAGPLPEVSDWLHLAAASAWVGGLWALALVMRTGVTTDERRELSRFTSLAASAVVAIVLTGVLAWVWLSRSFWADLGESTYGRLLLFKLALLMPMLGLGAWHFISGRREPRVRRTFAATVLGEAMLGVAVFVAASYLASTPPSFETTVGASPQEASPEERHDHSSSGLVLEAKSGAATATLHLDPARAGANEVEVKLDGIAHDSVDSVLLVALDPAGELTPVEVSLARGASSYSAEGVTFGIAGDWRLTVTVRSTTGSERTFEYVVTVRP